MADEPISYVVAKAIMGKDTGDPFGAASDTLGWRGDYGGTLDTGFYLRSLNTDYHADALEDAVWPGSTEEEVLEAIDARFGAGTDLAALWRCLYRNGLNKSVGSGSTFGEFDYTSGSGWMYSIGGSYYPGQSMSAVHLRDKDVLTLRYTLAYGWDIGGGSDNYGNVVGYCVEGRNGTIYVNHRWETAEDPDGSVRYVCRCCGMVQDCPHAHMTYKDLEDGTHILLCEDCQAVIGDPLPHNWTYDAGDTEDSHVCAECGAAEQHFWKEVEGTNTATCTEPGVRTVRCSVCGRDAKALLKELQSQNERMFLITFLVLNTGRTEQELENNVFQASSIAQKHNCNLCRLDFQQEQGLMSSLPLADCQIEIQRGLTTSSTAIFIPFTTQELYQSGKESLYYGLNALSNNLIMVDRKKLKNPNGLILGTPGSGKSFSAKREITNAFLVTDDDIIICDPEAEYAPLVERLHGQVIHIGPASTQYINPMDINSNYSEEDNPLALKADFILSLCELVVGGKEGLQPVEKTVIDRCVHVVYRKYFENPTPENMPLLEDLYNALLTQDEPEARHVAAALEIYVKGSLNIFNHHTNVDIHNRIVCFDIKQLGKQLKKLGMLIVQDAVWGRVTANRSAGKSTRYYADEFHLLLKEEQTAAYSVEIWKRFRKWGGIPTALTQNVKDLLASPEVSNIFENSDFVYMLNQANGDRQILAKQLNISPHQLSYVTHSGEGEGLLFFGNVILPFVDHFPKDLELYRILTTKLNEISEGAQK